MSDSKSLPIVVVACEIFREMLNEFLPDEIAREAVWLDYGLHRVPQKIRLSVQDVIDQIEEPSLILLGYGLCGNGISGIQSGKHTLIVPRMDDCITMLLGSYESYIQEFEGNPGTYYLSKGWLESGSHPLKEYNEVREKYGEKDANYIMDTQYQHYKRLVLVTHNQEDLDHYRPQALEVAEYCKRWGMEYEEILGSDIYVRRLAKVTLALEKADREFVIIPPGGEISLDQFIR
ncbi:MAG: DUF1638 domain-containing protein [Ardenticatenaceae bacterium]|nr:DUF1638 domain-containing protein [Ardenticatenaceae bacterium]